MKIEERERGILDSLEAPAEKEKFCYFVYILEDQEDDFYETAQRIHKDRTRKKDHVMTFCCIFFTLLLMGIVVPLLHQLYITQNKKIR